MTNDIAARSEHKILPATLARNQPEDIGWFTPSNRGQPYRFGAVEETSKVDVASWPRV